MLVLCGHTSGDGLTRTRSFSRARMLAKGDHHTRTYACFRHVILYEDFVFVQYVSNSSKNLPLGFYHEHSRFDRDGYIALNTANIQPSIALKILLQRFLGRIRQFDRRAREKVDDTGSYDLYSIMHYEQNAFALDKRSPTIIPRFSR